MSTGPKYSSPYHSGRGFRSRAWSATKEGLGAARTTSLRTAAQEVRTAFDPQRIVPLRSDRTPDVNEQPTWPPAHDDTRDAETFKPSLKYEDEDYERHPILNLLTNGGAGNSMLGGGLGAEGDWRKINYREMPSENSGMNLGRFLDRAAGAGLAAGFARSRSSWQSSGNTIQPASGGGETSSSGAVQSDQPTTPPGLNPRLRYGGQTGA
jgi:hypothetical protein